LCVWGHGCRVGLHRGDPGTNRERDERQQGVCECVCTHACEEVGRSGGVVVKGVSEMEELKRQKDSGDGDRQTDRRRGKERRRDDQKDCSHNDEASDWKDAVSIQFALINSWVVPCFDTGSPQFRTLGHAGFTEGTTPAVIPAFPEKCGVSQGACGQCEGPCVGPLCQTQAIPGHNTPQPICVITHFPDNGRAGPHLLTAPRLSQGVGLERRLGPPPHRSAAETRLGPNRINSNQH
ncbi:hypothetical protein F7725_028614, partial [Dissostichus mawsoni]